jgi:serine/threonine protein kinase
MPASPEERAVVPAISGRYRILKRLGSGSIGTVYLARDASLGRLVALKLIRPERLGEGGLEQLQSEFRSVAALRHPQIAGAFDFGYTEEGRVPFYTREYIEGEPFSLGPPDREACGSPRDFLRPFFDLLDALSYLHAHEILHLDIHAGNFIVAKDPRRGGVLIDFGLGGRAASPLSSPQSHLVFRPPEVLAQGTVGTASDLYSVGRLLLYRLTGSAESEPRLPPLIAG